ncbi:hypothetical protein ThrDRAFT_00930 [Frankia casuarinae]|uniref:Uncharacterized protein n=2 Tax=Frankiaceae TaxID=74712 RepID=Q2JDL4_FRACC|nr:hypothetical protein Francci3_1250 [Frankia casuarinae]ETA02891.1 hypothetical protein CcI6DRAFT_01640 [Frankia sp. CcI6]KDA43500.1 hypothetical protein BMG523Draft_01619 [Frankia sp. BMG5.23]KEZ36820.1 hypothetical protein CEDDRAFT_01801 [Frankia sp. CeD]EYT93381.1 hypothetical protein ThrDRAFT_00930 [Frankia casuarinae]
MQTGGVTPSPAGRRSRSMTDSPPWIGGVMVGTLLLSTVVLITYTLLPLPGQERLGAGNYVLAAVLFAANILLPRLLRWHRRRRNHRP